MKNNWILISLLSAFFGGIIAYILVGNWKLAIVSFFLIFIIAFIFDPKRFYARAFWAILSMGFGLNQFFFEITGNLFDIDFTFKSTSANNWTIVVLGILAALCLILRYLERGNKLKGTLFDVNKNEVGNISGNNINIHQSINKKDSNGDD